MYAFLCVQNKKKRKLTWREAKDSVPADTSSEIGQLMLYLVATHFKRFSVSKKHNIPLYMKDMKVSM